MRKIITAAVMSLLFSALCPGQGSPHISIFPPQMHQRLLLPTEITPARRALRLRFTVLQELKKTGLFLIFPYFQILVMKLV